MLAPDDVRVPHLTFFFWNWNWNFGLGKNERGKRKVFVCCCLDERLERSSDRLMLSASVSREKPLFDDCRGEKRRSGQFVERVAGIVPGQS